MSDCINCPYIQELRRELESHKSDIKENRNMIIDLNKTTERTEEKYNQIIVTVAEIKTLIEALRTDFTKQIQKVDRETAVNTSRLNWKFDLNWKTLGMIGSILLILLQMLLNAFVA